jgi:hypothetical protein
MVSRQTEVVENILCGCLKGEQKYWELSETDDVIIYMYQCSGFVFAMCGVLKCIVMLHFAC